MIVADDLDDVLILCHALAGEAWAVTIHRQNIAFECAVVNPQVIHDRHDERADKALLRGVITERHDRIRHAAAGHFALALADDPEVAESAHGFGAGGLHWR